MCTIASIILIQCYLIIHFSLTLIILLLILNCAQELINIWIYPPFFRQTDIDLSLSQFNCIHISNWLPFIKVNYFLSNKDPLLFCKVTKNSVLSYNFSCLTNSPKHNAKASQYCSFLLDKGMTFFTKPIVIFLLYTPLCSPLPCSMLYTQRPKSPTIFFQGHSFGIAILGPALSFSSWFMFKWKLCGKFWQENDVWPAILITKVNQSVTTFPHLPPCQINCGPLHFIAAHFFASNLSTS